MKNTEEWFDILAKQNIDIQKAKNSDYGNSFYESLDEFGTLPAQIRLTEKLNRIKQLLKSHETHVNDESLVDTLLDLSNYAIMTAAWLNCKKEQKEADEHPQYLIRKTEKPDPYINLAKDVFKDDSYRD